MMSIKLRGGIKSAGVLLFSQILISIAGPIVNLLVVRYLGPEDFGYYASALAVTSFIGILADFGINQATLKNGSLGDSELNGAFRTGLKVSMTLAVVAYFITAVWFYVLRYETLIIYLGLLFGFRYFITAFIAPCSAVLQTKSAYKKIALLSVITSAANWLSTLVMLLLGAKLKLLVGVPVFIYGIVTFFCFYYAIRQWIVIANRKGKCDIKSYLYDSLVFGLGGTFYKIYNQSDSALLSAMRPSIEVGFYQVSFGVIGLVYVIPSIVFNQVLYPKYFKLSKTDRGHYQLLYGLTSKLMLVLGCSLCLGIWAIGDIVIKILFGEAYTSSIIYLFILALAVPFRYWASAAGSVLTTDNLAERKVKIQGIVAVINLVINLIFIPIYGALCAAVTTVICEIIL
jgi:O-antigen/teichoic acid export membrane protein